MVNWLLGEAQPINPYLVLWTCITFNMLYNCFPIPPITMQNETIEGETLFKFNHIS